MPIANTASSTSIPTLRRSAPAWTKGERLAHESLRRRVPAQGLGVSSLRAPYRGYRTPDDLGRTTHGVPPVARAAYRHTGAFPSARADHHRRARPRAVYG